MGTVGNDGDDKEAGLARTLLQQARLVVIKVGSALLINDENGKLRRQWLDALADDVAGLYRQEKQVLIVSSGSIGLGRRSLGIPAGQLRLEDSQAAAATGQIQLAHAYQETLARHDIPVAQILLTSNDTEERRRYLNARRTMQNLLQRGVVPVVNENDSVATDEIRFGDNDRLAARVAAMVGADCLILLSDIDGLYTADPGIDPDARFIAKVDQIDARIEAMAGTTQSDYGRGGMVTKIKAAQIAVKGGCNMIIASGTEARPVARILDGGRGTVFMAGATPSSARKGWIAGSLKPAGKLLVDEGAEKALSQGKSLLPAGVKDVEGRFERGDAVSVCDQAGRELARGLIAYSAKDTRALIGRHSREIEDILGFRGRDEIIHRDDLVLL